MSSDKLIWSRYNFLIDNKKGHFLYNSYSNCLLRLDPEMVELLERLKNSDTSCLSPEEKQFFVKNQILVENDDELVETLHMHSMARLYSTKSFALTIAPTQSCNFACSYCYEAGMTSKPMSDGTAQSIVDYIKHLREDNKLEVLYLTWYGGEPLLQIDRVCSLTTKLLEIGIPRYEVDLITNGYYLTVKNISRLADVGVKMIQVTLDGTEQTHDKRRPLRNGGGSYKTILDNLDGFFANDFDKRITLAIRVNIDKSNSEGYVTYYHWLKERWKGHKFIVYPGIIFVDESSPCSGKCMSRNEVTDLLIGLNRDYGIKSEVIYPEDIAMECKARSPYGGMLIGSNGEIYKCLEDLGIPARIVGNINSHDLWTNFAEMAKYATGIDHFNMKECRECPYLPICNGGCPIRRYENVYCGKHNDCCTPFKGRIEEYIDLFLGKS